MACAVNVTARKSREPSGLTRSPLTPTMPSSRVSWNQTWGVPPGGMRKIVASVESLTYALPAASNASELASGAASLAVGEHGVPGGTALQIGRSGTGGA